MPLVLNNQKELDNVRAKILALKSFFMEEIYDLRQEISSVRSQLEQERLHHSRNNDCVEKEKNNNQELKDKSHSCQIENQLLREEIKNKQKTIETILKQNNNFSNSIIILIKIGWIRKMASIKSTNTNKKEVTANEMVTNQLQDQIKYQEKINNSKQYQTVAN